MAGTIPGVFNSSARTELAAVIAALAKPGGLHIALDNAGVVSKITRILAGEKLSTRPWQLAQDGDLWEAFEQAIKERNIGSIVVEWGEGPRLT